MASDHPALSVLSPSSEPTLDPSTDLLALQAREGAGADADGKYYSRHPELRGAFYRQRDLYSEGVRLSESRIKDRVMRQDGPSTRLRDRTPPPPLREDFQHLPPPYEKPVANVESASTPILQGSDVSSLVTLLEIKSPEDSVTATPTLPHDNIDGSSCNFPSSQDKLLAGAAESSSMLALQDMDVSSSDKDTTSSEESVTTTPFKLLHNTIDSSPPSASVHVPKIWSRSPVNWHQVYFIRMDRSRYFHMYPDLGGPFQSIDEAEGAINRHVELHHQARLKEREKMSNVERQMHECYYFYPDGTPRRGPEARKRKNTHFKQEHYLVQALVDQYNDDNHHFEDFAHELESIVKYACIYENERTFYHFNFKTKTKAASGILFFAEVSCMLREDVWEVSCCCEIKSGANGHCFGCKSYGSHHMQHPNDINAYIGGHLDVDFPFGGDDLGSEDSEAEEDRLRAIFEELEDPDVLEEIYRMANTPT